MEARTVIHAPLGILVQQKGVLLPFARKELLVQDSLQLVFTVQMEHMPIELE